MKVLVISSFYPPNNVGGYELGCRDVVSGLQQRGHRVAVLTSTFGKRVSEERRGVYRCLHNAYTWRKTSGYLSTARTVAREIFDRRRLQLLIQVFDPDLIYVWSVAGLPISLLNVSEDSRRPVVHFVSDESLPQWASDPWHSLIGAAASRSLKRWTLRKSVPLAMRFGLVTIPRKPALAHAQFASAYLREAITRQGFSVRRAEVIHWGVGKEWFGAPRKSTRGLRLLYAGRIDPAKGVETAIKALGLLGGSAADQTTLSIVGGANWPGHEQYLAHLRGLVASCGLEHRVRFVGPVERHRMPDIYATHDILLFTSVYQEPFSIGLLEAMASGLTVVSTVTGGTGEVLVPEMNGLAFTPGEAEECACQLERLVEQPELRFKLATEARRTISEAFCFDGMLSRVEKSLMQTLTWCESA